MLSSREIRQKFLDFFAEKGHQIVPSAPLVMKNDPTLLFTNAGMNPFKDLFLGVGEIKYPRIADTQKCLRVSGKHNDLEEVGHDTYHHTLFEMLGNWSFGDYFKEDAIAWAWELLTEVYGLDKSLLYVTVFGGDEAEGLGPDEEAKALWLRFLPEDRILYGSKKDNFWEMGDTGPCGPCSELHVDLRSPAEREALPGKELVNNDHPQVVEIWNLVFMEFNRKANGSLEKLPAKHVDTGMGFERLCMALQGKTSNYDTDVFTPLLKAMEGISGKHYGAEKESDIAMRVIADHIRAVAFAIADGQLPSNGGAGYVIRRILRRAVRYGFTFLNLKEPFLHKLVLVLDEQMGDQFPEIRKQAALCVNVIREEEQSFLRTLEQGLNRLSQLMNANKGKTVDGASAFELYDTYGFPVDLTQLILRENGLQLDVAGFEAEMQKQKERSKAAGQLSAGDWVILQTDEKEEFVGYDHLEAKVKITRYRKVTTGKKEVFQVVFNLTPFYPEGGGQVGDKGVLELNGSTWPIVDTKKETGLILHFMEELPTQMDATFLAVVDGELRKRSANHHSATHLLHEALREVLGEHVEQKGSLVHPDHLRFDFSHFQKVTSEEIKEIEQRVNARIRANYTLEEYRNIPMDQALEMGAMALFGEKYGDTVRAIKFGSSIELCGGTHVPATGAIGQLVITAEGAVAAGIRRIEALAGARAEEWLREKVETLHAVQEALKAPKDPLQAIEALKAETADLKKQVDALLREKAQGLKKEWLAALHNQGVYNTLVVRADLDAAVLKDLLFQLKAEQPGLIAVVGSAADGKAGLQVLLPEEAAKAKGWNASNLVKEWAKHIQGGGGGQPFYATAGGKLPSGLDAALQAARKWLNEID